MGFDVYWSLFVLQNSQDELHKSIWSKVDTQKSAEITSIKSGAEMVDQDANVGFIIESAQAEQIMAQSFCNLATIGDLGQRHYALPFPKGSKLQEKVSRQILTYIENGAIYRLKTKWSPSKNCTAAENEAATTTLVRAIPYSK